MGGKSRKSPEQDARPPETASDVEPSAGKDVKAGVETDVNLDNKPDTMPDTNSDVNPKAEPSTQPTADEDEADVQVDVHFDPNPDTWPNTEVNSSQWPQDPLPEEATGAEGQVEGKVETVLKNLPTILSTSRDRTAKGSNWWEHAHQIPAPGDPDRPYLFTQRVESPLPREEIIRRVMKYNSFVVGDGTFDDRNPMGDHLRASTPPMERVRKTTEKLVQGGMQLTDENLKTFFEHYTRNSGLVASLQEYAADKKDVPVEHVNKLLQERDELMYELARQCDHLKKQANRGTESDDYLNSFKHKISELEQEKEELQGEISAMWDRIWSAQEELEKNKDSCRKERVALQMQVEKLESLLQRRSEKGEASGEMDEESRETNHEKGIQTDFDTKPDRLVSAEARLVKAQKQIDDLKAFCEHHYKEIKQEQSSWGVIIKIISQEEEVLQKVPHQARKFLYHIYEKVTEMERRFLMNWPGIGPSLSGQTVVRDILTLNALEKAKASLEMRVEEVLKLNSELDAHLNIQNKRMREATQEPEKKEERQFGRFGIYFGGPVAEDLAGFREDLSAFIEDDMMLDAEPLRSGTDKQKDEAHEDKHAQASAASSPMVFPSSPEDLKSAVSSSHFPGSATLAKDVFAELEEEEPEVPRTRYSAMTAHSPDIVARHNETIAALEREKEKAEAEAEKERFRSHHFAAENNSLHERWVEARDKAKGLEKEVVELKKDILEKAHEQKEEIAASLRHYDRDAQFRTIKDILQQFSSKSPTNNDGKSDESQPEANRMDQLNSFNIQFMLSLRTLTLEALQQGWTQGAHRMLDIFNKWFHSFKDQLTSLNQDVSQEIEGSRYILKACWHLWHDKDAKMARDAQVKGYDKLKAVSDPWKIDAYLKLAKKLEEDVDALEKRNGTQEGISPLERRTTRQASFAQAAQLAGVSEYQIQAWKVQMQSRDGVVSA